MGICYIVGAGEFTARDFRPQKGDFVIAADGGLKPLLAMGCKPDLLLGDLDSLGAFNVPDGIPLERFPVEKDETDTGIALAQGWAMGYRIFHLYGCGGGRVDHLLANFQSMGRYSQMGACIRLVAQEYDAYAVTNGSLLLPIREAGTTLSVFCHGDEARGVTLRGLKYPLENAQLTCGYPLGVSNQHLDVQAQITVAEGTLLIIQYLKLS